MPSTDESAGASSPGTGAWRLVPEAAAYARPLRLVAIFVVVTSALWEVAGLGLTPDHPPELFVVRGIEAGVAAAVAVFASPTRRIETLRLLIFVLALDVAMANYALVAVMPAALWEALFIVTTVILASALFAPWDWRWQAVLAGIVVLGALVALLPWAPEDVLPGWLEGRIAVTLVTVGAVSVLGAHVIHRERSLLVQSEHRYHGLFNAAGDAIAVFNQDGVLVEGNRRLERLLARRLEQLRGRRLGELITLGRIGSGGTHSSDSVMRAVAEEVVIVPGVVLRPGGRRIDVEVALVRVHTGRDWVLQAIVRDLTERRALERREAQAHRIEAIGRMAASVSHQFNNLLGGILAQAGLLAESPDGATRAQVHAIAEAARKGRQLTKTLLRFTPHTTVVVKPTAAGDVLRQVAELTRAESGHDVEIVVDVAPDLPPVAADPDHLIHALTELALNARDAVRERAERRITLAARAEQVTPSRDRDEGAPPGHYVRFTVRDTGRGMDADQAERMFEPFFSTAPMHEREGLGLATVYWVLRAHKGTIAIDTAPGEGTAIHLLIPTIEADAGKPVAAKRPEDEPATVLVVDDDPLIRKTMTRALSKFGYRVIEAEDGEGALQALDAAQGVVALAILDVVMPGGGVGLVRQIQSRYPAVRMMISTGYGPGGEVQRMLEAGACGFLQKPFEISELRDTVHGVLS